MEFSLAVRRIYDALAREDFNLTSPNVDALFRELVTVVTASSAAECDLNDAEISRLQAANGRREFAFEKEWAGRVIAADDPHAEFGKFPYLKNYFALTKLEWTALERCRQHRGHRVLFCGGGPLPMTAIALAKGHGVPSTVIDIEPEAVALSRQVLARLGLSSMITVEEAVAGAVTDYGRYSVVFVAALAGLAPGDKAAIFRRIKETSGQETHIIARSGQGNRKLLYRPLGPDILEHVEPILRVERQTDVDNGRYFVSIEILKTHART
jgi:nicotianamine synthase